MANEWQKNEAEMGRVFDGCLKEAKKANTVPAGAFENFRVKRGLREMDGTGVMAGVTNIGNAHGYMLYEGERIADAGKLEYRGFDMTELVDGVSAENRYGFEECAYILLFGKLPSKEELDGFKALLASKRHLPERFTEDILMKAPSPSIMNKMAMGVLALYAYDENPDDTSMENMLRQSIEIIARLPSIAAHAYAVYRSHYLKKGLNLHIPKDELGTAQNFLRMLRSNKQYTEEEARLLDLCMIIQAEHGGGNNSTFTCRVLSSSGTDTYSAISGAIGSLKGPLHGGANIKVQEMFDCFKDNIRDVHDDEEVAAFIQRILNKEAYDGKGLIYGMGHAIYTKSDPRAVILKKYAEDLAVKKGYGRLPPAGDHRASDARAVQSAQGAEQAHVRQRGPVFGSGLSDAGDPRGDVYASVCHGARDRLVRSQDRGVRNGKADHSSCVQVHFQASRLHGA